MKTIVSLLLFCISLSTHAQISKGNWMVGGTGEYAHTKTKESPAGVNYDHTDNSYEFSPGAGYFFADRLCGGIRFNLIRTKTNDEYEAVNPVFISISASEIKTSGTGVSPFLRYYLLSAAGKFNVFGDISYARAKEKVKSRTTQQSGPAGNVTFSESSSRRTYNSNYYSLAGGPAIFINKKVSFEITLTYTLKKVSNYEITSDRLMVGTGFQVFLGK